MKSEAGIRDMNHEESRMYRYHQRLIDRKPNYGWQRDMVSLLTQQANMDHWLSCAILRPERATHVLSLIHTIRNWPAEVMAPSFDIAI